jgi:hypothetical protein
MPRKAKPAAVPAIDPKLIAAADELGQVRAGLEPLKSRERAAMDVLLAAGTDVIEGRGYIVKVSTSTRMTLDTTAARKALGAVWVAANTSPSSVRSLKATPRHDVINAALTKLAA